MFAKKLKYHGMLYEFSHAEGDILVYINQPCQHYDDWVEDGGILIVKHRPYVGTREYKVLHKLRVNVRSAYIDDMHDSITDDDRIAQPYD